MKAYNVTERRYPATSRNKRVAETGTAMYKGSASVPSGGGYSGTGTGSAASGPVNISQGEGIIVDKNAENTYTIRHGNTSFGKSTLNSGLNVISNIEIDKFGHVLQISSENILLELNDMFLRKDIDDTAHGVILFDKKIGSSVFLDGFDGKGWEVQDTGNAIFNSIKLRSDIFLGGKVGSPSFASGFTGWGWEIDTPTATGEMDNLFIRKTFTAYEIVYSQIYGLGGSQIVSDLNKILRVEVMGDRYRCYMDDMDGLMLMNMRKGDGVRIQSRTGTTSVKYIMGRCIGTDSDYFDIAIPLLEGTGKPEAGDFAMRWGNNEDADRQGLIYLTSADHYAPFIDVYDGITDVSTEGKLKARLGKLNGIRTQKGDQLAGYGAYLNGVYVENSTILLQDGDTVEQRFVAMNGRFDSEISGIKNDMSLERGNILRNSSFSADTNYWIPTNIVHFINTTLGYLWLSGFFYVEKEKVADIFNDNGQNVLRIRSTSILQKNEVMRLEGVKEERIYSFSFFVKILSAGTLTAGIPGSELLLTQTMTPAPGYQRIVKVGKWNEEGDFSLSYTGECLIYGVSLFNDALADVQIKLNTRILQTEEMISLMATKDYVDRETGAIKTHYDSELLITAEQMSGISTRVSGLETASAGWITTADSIQMFASKKMENGREIINTVNVDTSGVKIKASKIDLYGMVSFSMFDAATKQYLQEKADESEVSNLAANIANKVDITRLRSYALTGGANITKEDLQTALKNEITGKLTGTATTNAGKLADIIVNGQAFVAGGYIQADYINVDTLISNIISTKKLEIGRFEITNYGGLRWKATDYIYANWGEGSYKLMLGNNSMEGVSAANDTMSMLHVYTKSTKNHACISAVIDSDGKGIAIYGSTDGWGSNFPAGIFGNVSFARFAGFFSGNTFTTGYNYCTELYAKKFRYATELLSDGSIRYLEGINFDPVDYDLDDVRFRVRGGLIVGVTDDSGRILKGV